MTQINALMALGALSIKATKPVDEQYRETFAGLPSNAEQFETDTITAVTLLEAVGQGMTMQQFSIADIDVIAFKHQSTRFQNEITYTIMVMSPDNSDEYRITINTAHTEIA